MEDPFEDPGKQFRRAINDHLHRMREEMDRARTEMRMAMDRARDEIERAKSEFQRSMDEARRQFDGARDWTRPDAWVPPVKRRRPRRKPPGGEPVPVKPRPKPKPLVDGAEAPID